MTPLLSGRRTLRRGTAGAISMLVLANVGAFYVVSQSTRPVTVGDALAQFRSVQALSGVTNFETAASRTADLAPRAGTGEIYAQPNAAGSVGVRAAMGMTGSSGPMAAPAQTTGSGAGSSAGRPGTVGAAGPGTATAGPGSGNGTPGPPPGVYVFSTSGYETVSALGGSRHDYPSQTTITFTNTRCGVNLRWDGLQQRWDQYDLCVEGSALRMVSYTAYHDFFGQVDERTYDCAPGTYLLPPNQTTGATFAGSCTSGGGAAAVSMAGQVVARGTMAVAGAAVPAVHVQIQERLTGATKGTRSHDMWFALTNQLPIVFNSVTDAQTQTTFGYTAYHEQLVLSLRSTQPLR